MLKGKQVIIPKTIQEHLLTLLHMGHQGIEKTKLCAKDCVYWLDITKDIPEISPTRDSEKAETFHKTMASSWYRPLPAKRRAIPHWG